MYLTQLPHVNSWHIDSFGRGAIQLASNSQGKHHGLAHYLRTRCSDDQGNKLPETYAQGRPKAEQTRGGFQEDYRKQVTYNPSKAKGMGHGQRGTYDDDELLLTYLRKKAVSQLTLRFEE